MSDSQGRLKSSFQRFRSQLAFHDATPQLVVLGIIVGLFASLLIVAFRLLFETPLIIAFDGEFGNFESLSLQWRFLLPLIGALIIGLLLHCIDKRHRQMSITHVLDRLHRHQGRLPFANMLLQFVGGIIAFLTGQSVGREGPSVHLGAGVGSLTGQALHLPNNSLRTLIACGAAAGIAASFNTPMAGVVFAMEVILMEYTISSFIPIIIASVMGSAITQLFFGADINVLPLSGDNISLQELPYLILVGVLVSVAAATFIKVHMTCMRWQSSPVLLRFLFMGLLTGSVAMFVPQIMGMGYDTINSAIAGNLDVQLLLLIFFAKLLVTAVVTGLGMIGGLIGPTLVIGACLGGVLGAVGSALVPGASSAEFYVLLGMAAMMGAVLNAPLAALVAILELSYSPEIIFPSMLIVVVACLGVQLGFRYHGIFNEQLRHHGLDLFSGPGKGFLSRVGVTSVMNRSFVVHEKPLNQQDVNRILAGETLWLVFPHNGQWRLLASADLARLESQRVESHDLEPRGLKPQGLEQEHHAESADTYGHKTKAAQARAVDQADASNSTQSPVDVSLQEPVYSFAELSEAAIEISYVDVRATLHEASEKIRDSDANALLVLESMRNSAYSGFSLSASSNSVSDSGQLESSVEAKAAGVVTRETIVNFYGM